MSEFEKDLERKLTQLGYVVKLGYALIVGAFALGVWVATIELRTQSHSEKLSAVTPKVESLVTFREISTSTHMTAKDVSDLLSPIRDAIVLADKRITRVEDSQAVITEYLKRIDSKIPSKP